MRFLTAGESHGPCLVGIVEGFPGGVPIDVEGINSDLARRQQGYGRGGGLAIEQDQVEILTGLVNGGRSAVPLPCALLTEII